MPLSQAINRTAEFLRAYGDVHVAGRLDDLHGRLASDPAGAIETAVIEATGSMGSLRDRILCVANGDRIRGEEEEDVNARLRALVREIEISARSAAEVVGVRLAF